MGILNSLFGSKSKRKESGTASTESTESERSNQRQSTQSDTTRSAQQDSVTSQTGTTDRQTAERQSSQQQQTQAQEVQSRTRSLDAGLLAGLEGTAGAGLAAVQELLAGADSQLAATGERANFDVAEFVTDLVTGARQNLEEQSSDSINALQSRAGGTAGTNSQVALLADRINRNQESALAGVAGQAQQQGQQIANQNQQTFDASRSSIVQDLASLAQVASGAQQVSTQQQTGQVQTAGQAQTDTSSEEQTAQQSQTQLTSTEQEQVRQLLEALLQREGTRTTETEQEGTITDRGRGRILAPIQLSQLFN